jgi:hypothetical protein
MSNVAGSVCADIKARGWRCGAVVPLEMYGSIGPFLVHPGDSEPAQIGEDDWPIVISHSCDITASQIAQEPFVEVLLCRGIAKRLPQFTNRRSTRRLHFCPNRELNPAVSLNAHAVADRYIVPRTLLANFSPCPIRRLSDVATNGIQSWYALRNERPAWPDEFNRRISGRRRELEDALEPLDDGNTELRVIFREDTEGFELVLFLVIDEQMWTEDPKGREVAIQCFNQFVATLNTCEGISVDLDESVPINGAKFTWQAWRESQLWNFANLTPIESLA